MSADPSVHPPFGTFDYTKVIAIPEVMLRVELLDARLKQLGVSRDERVLEVGVGSGDVTLMLTNHFDDLTCVDPDEGVCELVGSRLRMEVGKTARFLRHPIERAPLDGEYFDHVMLIGILEHLRDPVETLRLITQVMKPGGRVYICVNLANSLHRLLGVEMGQIGHPSELSPADIRLGHYRVYDVEQLREHVSRAAMKVVYDDLFYVKPLPTSMLTPLPLQVHRALNSLARRLPQYASYVYLEATAS